MSTTDNYANAYRDVRDRVSALVRDVDADSLEVRAPAAPDWRVRDLLAHLSGVCADITAGNLDGVATDPWTAVQVETRRSWPLDRLLAEWDEHGTAVEALVPSFPEPLAVQFLTDAATHEHDIRGGLGRPGARDADSVALLFPGVVRYGLDAGLRLDTEHGSFTSGTGEADAETSVRAPRFELFRAMTGRRSLDQIRAYNWAPEPRPEALVIGLFTPRETPLDE